MKNKLSIALLTLATSGLMLGGASFALADKDDHSDRQDCQKERSGHGAHHQQGGFGKMKHALHKLDLSSEQKSAIDDIINATKPQMEAIHNEMKEGREDLRALSQGDTFDQQAVNTAARDQANLMAQTIVLRAKSKADIWQVLTPEQRQQMDEKFASTKHH